MVSRFVLIAAATALAGCSLLVDNSGFVGEGGVSGDAATADGGLDAGPDAPSSPVVHIEPATPSPGDALDAVVDTESVDPLDAGAITYEYRWLRDGSDASITTSGVPADTIALGETWRVEVTPVTTDGRRGVPGAAMVTVGNSPPTLGTVGLSTYRPILGDSIDALPGTASDPDGDSIAVVYEWFLDDAVLAGATSSRLTVDPGWTPGSRLRVEAHAVDSSDAESTVVSSGDAILLGGRTHWVQLLPDRNNVLASVRDTRHERVVLIVRHEADGVQVWEHDLGSDRFVRLRPTGEPSRDADFQNDFVVGNGRYFLVGNTGGAIAVEMLDLRQRGAETWSTLELDPSVALSGRLTGGVYDDGTDTLYVALESGGTHDLVAFDLTTSPVTPTVLVADTAAPIERAGWAYSPDRAEILLIGGLGSDLIHRLDLSGSTRVLEELPGRAPISIAGSLATWDGGSHRYLFGYGLTGLDTIVDRMWWFDPVDGGFTELDTTGGPDGSFYGWLGEVGERLLFAVGGDNPFAVGEYELLAIERASNRLEDVHRFGVDLPPPLMQPFAGVSGFSAFFYGGLGDDGVASDQVWRLPLPARVPFSGLDAVVATADPVEGTPGPRRGHSGGDLSPLYVFGGDDGTDAVAGPVFRLRDTAWEALTMAADSGPSPRSRAAMFAGCGELSIFGGTTGSGRTAEVWQLDCGGAGCSWSEVATMGTGPSARAGAAVGLFGQVLYGGFDTGVLADAYGYDGCGHRWTPLTQTGATIGPRQGHGMTTTYLFGGYDGATYRNETYHLQSPATGQLAVTELAIPAEDDLPAGRSQMAIVSDPDSGRIYVYGGYRGDDFFRRPRVLADLWELRP